MNLDSYLLKMLKVTEMAALGAYRTIGLGDARLSDQEAVRYARDTLNSICMRGTIVVGEGERDEAPMLWVGESVGTGLGSKIDIAIDPLECTSSCADGKANSMASMAFGPQGCFMGMPDVYMDKLAVSVNSDKISIALPVEENLRHLSEALDKPLEQLRVVVLNRPRHAKLISDIRKTGARVMIIEDGDIWGVISVVSGENDMYVGTGGSPEGVLAASALRNVGGFFEGRLIARNASERDRIENSGIEESKIYRVEDLSKQDTCFIATGVTDGDMVSGVENISGILYRFSSVIINKGITMNIERTMQIE